MNVGVFGAGLVGSTMAKDLADEKNWKITVLDGSEKSLDKLRSDKRLALVCADLSKDAKVREVASKFDLIIGALPGFMGFKTVKSVIEAKRNIVDISFFPENSFLLDKLAKKNDVTAIVDCGVAPGCSNMLSARGVELLDSADTCICYVGGLPEVRTWPYEYKIVFSAVDVIEEYTRPARYIENNVLVTRPALSDPEFLDFEGVGTLEAFNTDGLRTLADTLKMPNMKEKTMRYPGHIEKMRVLRETGFFSKEPVQIGGASIRPLDFTAKLLFPMWKLKEGEKDFTVMRVIVEGLKNGKKTRVTYDLLDRYDDKTGNTSMARTTGYAGTVAARMFAAGVFTRKGICPPEYFGMEEKAYKFMIAGMKARNINYVEKIEEIK
ncbi:MAG: saccharopine dehydrogenase NADP-binding domain-containing protein [Elusimicrobia bacterium]|nr:saccharopine dehydrogenase NADP-binding domain-containing protein [Elusimicrobiota bacterium]